MADMVISITLDAKELRRQLGLTEEEIAKIDGKKIKLETAPAQSAIGSLRDSIAGWTLALAGAMKAAKAVAGVIKDVAAAAMFQQKAELELAATLKNTGIYSKELETQLKNQASAIQAVTTAGDEEILMATRQMQVIGRLSSEQLPAAQKAAVGLAKAYQMDLKTAFELVGKAAAGNTAVLGRYGIVLDQNMSQAEKFDEVLRRGAEGFDLARAETETAAGAIQQLSNVWGDLKETIGDAFLPVLADVARGLTGLINRIIGGKTALESTIGAITSQRVEFERLVIVYTRLHKEQERTEEQNKQYRDTVAELVSKFPNYLENINLEKDSWEDVSAAIDSARSSLQKYINTKIQEAVLKDMEDQIVNLSVKRVKLQDELDTLTAEFDLGIKNRREMVQQAQKTVTDPYAESVAEYVEVLSVAGLKEQNLIKKIEKHAEEEDGLRESMQKRLEVAQTLYALPPKDEPGGDLGDGSGTGVSTSVDAEASETAKAYEKLLENLRKYHSDAALANLDAHQKKLALLSREFDEEQELILASMAAKEITEEEGQARLVEVRAKYDAEALIVQKAADGEILKLAQKRIEQAIKDEGQYYEMMKFADQNYFEWKKRKIEEEVSAMSLSDDQKMELIRKLLEELEQLKKEYGIEDEGGKSRQKSWFFSGILGFDPEDDEDLAKIQAIKDTYNSLLSQANSVTSGLMRLSAQRRDQEIADLEARVEKEGLSNEWLMAEKKRITDDYEAEDKRYRRIQKTLSLGQATVNIAEGVTKALSMGPIIGPILAAVITSLGAVQIGIISAQKFASGGLFRGKGGPRDDANLAYLSDGEYIVNAAATKRFKPVLDAINYGQNIAPVSKAAYADGGMVVGGGHGLSEIRQDVKTVIDRLEVINLNLVKKKVEVSFQGSASAANIRDTDASRLRMEERGYDPSFAQ